MTFSEFLRRRLLIASRVAFLQDPGLRVDRTVLIKTIDPPNVYASVSFRFRPWAAGRAVVACVLAAHETFAGATNKFCRGLSAGYKDSGTGTQEIGTSVSSGGKNLFLLPTAHRGMYIMAGKKAAGIRYLTIEPWPQRRPSSTICALAAYVCALVRGSPSVIVCLCIRSGIETQVHSYTSTDRVQRHVHRRYLHIRDSSRDPWSYRNAVLAAHAASSTPLSVSVSCSLARLPRSSFFVFTRSNPRRVVRKAKTSIGRMHASFRYSACFPWWSVNALLRDY